MRKILLCIGLTVLSFFLTVYSARAQEFDSDRVSLIAEGDFPQDIPYISNLTSDAFEDYLIRQLQSFSTEIPLSEYGLTTEEFKALYQSILNRHPKLFFVGSSYRYSFYPSNGIIASLMPAYRYQAEELPLRVAIFEHGVNAVIDYAQQSDTTIGRLLRANDYLCAHYEYDLDNSPIFYPDEFFEQGKGVCQAYTLAFGAVLDELNIPWCVALSEPMNHIWNIVQVDDSWYHIDVTWNDPFVPLSIYHDNFLLSDKGITSSGHHDWTADVSADALKYDSFFWRDIRQAIPLLGDTAYFIEVSPDLASAALHSVHLSSGIDTLSGTFDITDNLRKNSLPLWVNEETAYYALGNSLYSMPLSCDSPVRIYESIHQQDIQYFYQEGDILKMYVASSPASTSGNIEQIPLNESYTLELNYSLMELTAGYGGQLIATLNPTLNGAVIQWQSDDPSVGFIADGFIEAMDAGVTTLFATYGTSLSASCTLVVHDISPLHLPTGVQSISDEAFMDINATEVILNEGIQSIGEYAFADMNGLKLINLPASLEYISETAFDGNPHLTLLCQSNTIGAEFAVDHAFQYIFIE